MFSSRTRNPVRKAREFIRAWALVAQRAAIGVVVGSVLLLPHTTPAQGQDQKPTSTTKTVSSLRSFRSRHALRHAHTRTLVTAAVARGQAVPAAVVAATAFDPPEQTVGERLFLETRFSQFFATHHDGNVNLPLAAGQGDPTVAYVQTTNPAEKILGPFAGMSINCRSCHFVDDVDYGNRTYADYTRRSLIPDRADNHGTAPRNALNMVDSNIERKVGLLLHGDGEFATVQELIDSTMTSRNFGWLPPSMTTPKPTSPRSSVRTTVPDLSLKTSHHFRMQRYSSELRQAFRRTS